jgi:hypothetical protein
MPTTGFEVRGTVVRQHSPEFASVAVTVAVKSAALCIHLASVAKRSS